MWIRHEVVVYIISQKYGVLQRNARSLKETSYGTLIRKIRE